MRDIRKVNDSESDLLKQKIGFGLAFKATLGFYFAKLLVQIVTSVLAITIISGIAVVLWEVFK